MIAGLLANLKPTSKIACQLVNGCSDWHSMNRSNAIITSAFVEQHRTKKLQLLLVADVISSLFKDANN